MATRYGVLSLNAWGVPNATARLSRMRGIAAMIAENKNMYDLICMQEVFVAADARRMIQAGRKAGLEHWHVFRNGAGCWGSNSPGLVVLSRLPIAGARLCRFACSGKPYRLDQMDGMHHKACAAVFLEGGDLGPICVYVAHLVAKYGARDEYRATRLLQAHQMARFMQETSKDASLVVLCADLNAEPLDDAYTHLVTAARLKAIETGPTYARNGNPYCTGEPQQIDHVLWRATNWTVRDAGVDAYTHAHDLSDHAGVFAEFVRGNPGPGPGDDADAIKRNKVELMAALRSAIDDCRDNTRKYEVSAASALVFAVCVYSYVPWLTALAGALAVVHFIIYGTYCGEEMSSLVQAHNEVAADLGCPQDTHVLAVDMGDAFEAACAVLAMGG